MEQLKGIISRTQPLTDSVSLTTRSGTQLSADTGRQLLTMMAEAQAYKPNQTLPPGTPDVYLQAWEEIVQRFGLTTFRDGLWKALRSSAFFPDPSDIEEQCKAISEAAHADKALAKIKAEEQAFKDSGEVRTNVADLMRSVIRKQADKKEPPLVMITCPHCSNELPVAQNIRVWEPEEMRQQAARIEEIRRIADKNRQGAAC